MNNQFKYDLNDDVDDRTFLAGPNYNKPSSAVADFQRKQQLLLLEKNKLEDSCLQSAKNSMILINESEQIGIKTGVELLEQKEKLGRIEDDLNTISGVTRQSQQHIKAMDSGMMGFMFGGLKSMFKKKKPDEQIPTIQPRLKSSQSANNFNDNPLNSTMEKLRSNSTHDASQYTNRVPETIFETKAQTTSGKKDFNAQLDGTLCDMQSGIGRLKSLALSLGKEIDEQNETLDVIANKADRTNTTIQVQNKAILKQLKK